MTDSKRNALMLTGNDPLIIALDISASMQHIDAANGTDTPHGKSRWQLALEVADDLIRRTPKMTPVTVLAFGGAGDHTTLCTRGTPTQARAALQVPQPNASEARAGRLLEHVLHEHLLMQIGGGVERANLVIITDGEIIDMMHWEAWSDWNIKYGQPLCVTVLTCGDAKWDNVTDGSASSRSRLIVAPLHNIELQLSTPTGSDRPGDVEPAKRPTAPPSIQPPVRTVHDALGVTHEHARQSRIEHGDGYDIGEPRNALRVHPDDDTPLPTVLQDVLPPAEAVPVPPARIELSPAAARKATEYVDAKRHAPEPPAKHGKSTRPSGSGKR